ncbi:two component transcriptional regulator, LuxR family [Leptolyngbya sp. NIES-3755]|nr:two component transcriptional regulator, LuxR family [Leptolyngbya sp. NIES-3755]
MTTSKGWLQILAIALFEEHQSDVTLTDLRMPEVESVAAIGAICAIAKSARIIVLTTYDSDEDIYRGLQAGAKGYLWKETEPDELLNAIRTVHRGQKYIPPDVGAKLVQRLSNPELSERELAVLHSLAQGRADSLKKRKEVRNVVSQMTNAFRDGGKTMQSKQVKGDCAEDCKISWSIAITERSDVLTHDDIFRIVEAILNVPMLSDTTAQFFGIRRQGTKVEHGFVNWLSATNTRALDANQALHTYPSCIQSRQGFQNTDRALRGAVSRMFNVICDAISRMLLKLGCNPFVKLGLILLDGNHVVIATVDDLLNGFFGCARHPY